MGDPLSTAIILGVGTAVTAAGTGYQIAASEEAKEKAEAAAAQQEAETTRMIEAKNAEDQRLIDEQKALEQRNAQRSAQRARQSDYQGRRGTILTGLGSGGRKTVLGSV